ncbi:Septum site-determining protein MinD [Methyloligella halotolerans]|uniref:Iron-sulfur cluster carrier protein n=1 Tax=Methyloligella halotolerans TaxID=1177755 RepID=A0A1E2RV29_9HYPH|nr:iron-sulfur cluster carrier protein ApbC [Methyloligella halotolerans]ODA66012.1 Septum site-determining protein MinD [Methyloligella halotolerans]
MSEAVTKEQVLDALKRIPGPDGKGDIVAQGLLSEIVITQGKVYFSISVNPDRAKALEGMRVDAEHAVKSLPGVEGALVTLTADREPGSAPPPSQSGNGAGGNGASAQSSPFDSSGPGQQAPTGSPGKGPGKPQGLGTPGQQNARPKGTPVPGVKSIIAVASGKGGVGKSTTAVNLALGLKALGKTVGILDADIYGPSMPRLLALEGKPQELAGNKLQPMEAFGMKVMSMGFLVDEETPMIWRGPMVMSALSQMLKDVEWGELDVLVVDMPPGTGDAQLTMAQQVPLAGAVIVSTPQDLALIDARKGLNMFKKVDVPVLGIVENMSTFICPHCGGQSDIFGHGGARHEAERLGVPFLGEVPLTMEVRETSDSGEPLVVSAPDSEPAKAYLEIARKAAAELDQAKGGGRAAPKIVMEQ